MPDPNSPEPMTSLHSVRAAGVLLYYDVNSDSKQGGTNMADPSERRFLLMRHVKRCNLPNGRGDLPKARWDLPKGHCDGKESFRETALREMEEETGITRSQVTLDPEFCFQLRYPVTYRRSGDQVFQKHVCYFLGRLSQKMPVHETEHDSHRWFAWNPPHKIQAETIDPLLSAIADHWAPS